MPISFYIHGLEFITAILSAFLLIQVGRAYRQDAMARFQNQSEQEGLAAHSQLDDIPILVDVVATNEATQVGHGNLQSGMTATGSYLSEPVLDTDASNAEYILNDYIGGFFNEPAVKQSEIDIKAFRAVEGKEADKILSSQAMNETLVTADITPFRAVPKTTHNNEMDNGTALNEEEKSTEFPVLNARIPEDLLTEAFIERKQSLDNESISVEEGESSIANEAHSEDRSNVMSNKVVLAMLDEAKVVSVS
jgi:hypothetical protein